MTNTTALQTLIDACDAVKSYVYGEAPDAAADVFQAALQDARAALSAAQDAPAELPELKDALVQHLCSEFIGAYYCTRVWEAWDVGTMDEHDFEPITDRVDDIADGLIAFFAARASQPTPAERRKSLVDLMASQPTPAQDAAMLDAIVTGTGITVTHIPSSEVRAQDAAATVPRADLEEMERRKDAAYEERNRVVAALAKCFPSGVARTAIEGWSEDWHGCVYIDLPTGQVSWHFHDSQAHLFADLPAYTKAWDGHDTPEKYRRVSALLATPPAPQAAPTAAQPVADIPAMPPYTPEQRAAACVAACEGLPDHALFGGWTAAGMSRYTQSLESKLAQAPALVPLTDAQVEDAIDAWFRHQSDDSHNFEKRMRAAFAAAGITADTAKGQG